MLEQVVELFFTEEHFGDGKYLDWELDNHLVGYGVKGEMYAAFFQALVDVVKEGVGQHWSEQYQQAWNDRIELIMSQVRVHPAVAETS